MPKQRRPCPRGLFDGCPIPRELCTEYHEKTGTWHCLKFLKDLEMFLFGSDEPEPEPMAEGWDESGEVTTLEDLMRVLEAEQ